MKKRRIIILLLMISAGGAAYSQIVFPEGLTMATTRETRIAISTDGDVINESSFTFDRVQLSLFLTGTNQQINGNLSLFNLELQAGGRKFINGNLRVRNALKFQTGILEVAAPSTLTFVGEGANVTSVDGTSYVDGVFFQRGGGRRFYPVGTADSYAPLEFELVQETTDSVGVQVFSGAPSPLLTTLPPIQRLLTDFYWHIEAPDPSTVNSRVFLPLPTEGFDPEKESVIVVQDVDGVAQSLGTYASSSSSTNLVSAGNVTSSTVAIAVTTEIDITIHELITPHGSFDKNDELEISNLHAFEYNKVIFLDRYGVMLKEWENYAKGKDKDFFKKLSPGNYIVIVEFGESRASTRRKSQMITVLRTK